MKLDRDEWGDRPDELTPFIELDQVLKSGRYDVYTDAYTLVSNRSSKGALVDLVNHLLLEIERGKKS